MMNIDECRIATATAVAEYGPIAYLCPACGNAYSGMPDWGYCDERIECTEPVWYVVADDAIVDFTPLCVCGNPPCYCDCN